MAHWQEALASLRVLVCIAKADGDISPSERLVLCSLLARVEPIAQSITVEQLISDRASLSQLLQYITSADARRAVYTAARSMAEQDGIHPDQQQLLDEIHSTFHAALSDPADDRVSDTFIDVPPYDSILAGIQVVAQRNRKARQLIFDYTLGAAVIGLISIPYVLVIQVLALIVLIVKMRRGITRLWRFSKGHDILAFAGSWFGSLGALAIALMAWLTVLAIGVFVPLIDSLAQAAAFATLTWAEGQVTNQFYMNSRQMERLVFQQSQKPARRWRLSKWSN